MDKLTNTPKKINRYEIRRQIKKGGMGKVYLAYDPNCDREVVIKTLLSEKSLDHLGRERFIREARIVAKLEGEAIVPVYDFFEEAGELYQVIRYMPGGSLADHLKHGPLTLSQAVQIINRLAPELDRLHKKHIVHRDLKPSNILFDKDGKAYLADFGIAKVVQPGDLLPTKTLTGNFLIGTPHYMSPEQIKASSHLDGRSDIYALGVILFEVLTKHLPYDAKEPAVVCAMHLKSDIPSLLTFRSDLPAELDQVIARAMAKDRENRYQRAQILADDLSAISTGNLKLAAKPEQPEELKKSPQVIIAAQETEPWIVQAKPGQVDALQSPVAVPEQISVRNTELVGWSRKLNKWLSRPLSKIVVAIFILALLGGLLILTPWLTGSHQSKIILSSMGSPTALTAEPKSVTKISPTKDNQQLTPPSTRALGGQMLIASSSSTATSTPTILELTGTGLALGGVEIYNGPGKLFPVLFTLSRTTQLGILGIDQSGFWYYILDPTGQKGWVSGNDVSDVIRSASIPVLTSIPTPNYTATPTATMFFSTPTSIIRTVASKTPKPRSPANTAPPPTKKSPTPRLTPTIP
jgi:serine/threonine protein kinase